MACARTVIERLLLTALLGSCACRKAESVVQPIAFGHAPHVKADVECVACHEGIIDRGAQRLPALEICTDCHEGGDDSEPPTVGQKRAAAALDELKKQPDPARLWTSAMRLESHTFFPHVSHTEAAKLECETCHTGIKEQLVPKSSRQTFTMAACIDCHSTAAPDSPAAGAIHDCARCHR